MTEIKADVFLDTSGLLCPMPVLKAKKAIDAMQSGQVIEIVASDPISKTDIPALIRKLGHELLGTKEDGQTLYFYVKKR